MGFGGLNHLDEDQDDGKKVERRMKSQELAGERSKLEARIKVLEFTLKEACGKIYPPVDDVEALELKVKWLDALNYSKLVCECVANGEFCDICKPPSNVTEQELLGRDWYIKALEEALHPLIEIADAYDANNLDDEARKFWGKDLENENKTDPGVIELYSGRGGKQLLTLGECLEARDLVRNKL